MSDIPDVTYTVVNLKPQALIKALRQLCDDLEAGTLIHERGGIIVQPVDVGLATESVYLRGELFLKRVRKGA